MHFSKTPIRTQLNVVEYNFSVLPAVATIKQIEQGKTPPALLPWIPLFQGADDDDIISRWKALADQQTDRELRKCLILAVLFAEAVDQKEPWQEALKGWNMIESQVVKEWTLLARQEALKQGLKEGLKEGEKKGKVEGKQETLLLILKRFTTPLPSDLEQAILRVEDLQKLDATIESALAVNDLDAFRSKTGL